MDNSYFYIRVRYRFNNYYGDKMKLSEMTLTELINEAERLSWFENTNQYIIMYKEMLRRLRNMSVKGKR